MARRREEKPQDFQRFDDSDGDDDAADAAAHDASDHEEDSGDSKAGVKLEASRSKHGRPAAKAKGAAGKVPGDGHAQSRGSASVVKTQIKQAKKAKKAKKDKLCRVCKRSAFSTDPNDSSTYLFWHRSGPRVIVDIEAGLEDALTGRVCMYCHKTHANVPEYKLLSIVELGEKLEDSEEANKFEGYRQGVVMKLASGERVRGDVAQESVTVTDAAFDRQFKTGMDVTLERWKEILKEKPEMKNRAKPVEKRLRDGTLVSFIRIYDQQDGEFRFEEGDEKRTTHEQIIDDGTMS